MGDQTISATYADAVNEAVWASIFPSVKWVITTVPASEDEVRYVKCSEWGLAVFRVTHVSLPFLRKLKYRAIWY